jgi:beta-fructofuranosidase
MQVHLNKLSSPKRLVIHGAFHFSFMRIFLFALLLIVLQHSANGQSSCVIAHWSFDETEGSVAREDITGIDFTISNNYGKPEKVSGISGVALRLDGFSTWASGNFTQLPARSFSVSVWYATEAYPTATAALINQMEGSNGFGLELTKYGKLIFFIHAQGAKHIVELPGPLPKYKWNLITAVADLDQQMLKISLNNDQSNAIFLPSLSGFNWSAGVMKIGQHNQTEIFAGLWPTGVLNGVIDEVSIYECALSDLQRDALFADKLPTIAPDLTIPAVRHINDPIRPRYHPMPPTSWTNEPYGLIYHDGSYHLFYQKNPNGPYHMHMHWGHLTSEDLIRWEDQPIALAPEPGWDQVGIWSGYVVEDEEKNVYAFYTGVDGAKAGIGVAHGNGDLTSWTKDTQNPLIPQPPSTYNHLDFRDPMIWNYNGLWHMIVGSGIRDVGGILMTYTSTDLINWQVAAPLYFDRIANSGPFWEMPVFFQASETKWVLIVNTVPHNGQRAETVYWVGEWSGGKFKPDYEVPKTFDIINGPLLAPSINNDADGRITAIGIIPETRNSAFQNRTGWTHIYSLPRVLRLLKDGNLGQTPHPNLCGLRKGEVKNIPEQVIIVGGENNLGDFTGNNLELQFKVVVDAERFVFSLGKSPDGYEYTDIIFDETNNKIAVDRTHSSISNEVEKDVREGAYTFSQGDTLDLRIFIDRSAVEIFVDQVASLSTRIYPTLESSKGFDLQAEDGSVKLLNFQAWTLDTADVVSNPCQTSSLRENFRTEIIAALDDERPRGSLKAYPNPATDFINVDSPYLINHLSLHSMQGTKVRAESFNPSGNSIDVRLVPPGAYILKVTTSRNTFYKRIIIKH